MLHVEISAKCEPTWDTVECEYFSIGVYPRDMALGKIRKCLNIASEPTILNHKPTVKLRMLRTTWPFQASTFPHQECSGRCQIKTSVVFFL